MAGKLQDRTAVITGGNSGIGLATAREFKANGAHVVIFGRSRQTLDEAAASLGDGSLAVQGDVRKLGDMDRLSEQTAKIFGKIDILVANAGIAKFAPVEILPESLCDELCDIHFKGAFFTVQKALPCLRDGASVILVSVCDADKQARFGTSIYTAAKAAVRSLARSLSVELLPWRIRVNVLSPGMTETPIITRERARPERRRSRSRPSPNRSRYAGAARPRKWPRLCCSLHPTIPVIASAWNCGRRHDAARKTSIDIRRRRSWQSLGTRYPLTHHRTKSSRPLDAGWPRSWWTADAKG